MLGFQCTWSFSSGEKSIVSLLRVGWGMLDIRKSGQISRFPTLHVFRLPTCLVRNPLPLPKEGSELIGGASAGACKEEPPFISQGTNSTSVNNYSNDGIGCRKFNGKKGDEVAAYQHVHFVFLLLVLLAF